MASRSNVAAPQTSWATVSHPALREVAVDALVAALATASAVVARIAIERVVGGVAPFVLTFPAVIVATLLRGGQAGTIATVSCQLLTIRYVFPNWVSTHGGIPTDLANMVLSTIALAGTVWATASHRRAELLHSSRCERRAGMLSLLVAEMNHRTKNNFQVAANLLAYQSLSSIDRELATELDRAGSRLETIAAVYEDLSIAEAGDKRVDLGEHLGRITDRLRIGATPDRVLLSLRAGRVDVPADTAVVVGLIVNEWITNALKHAFDGQPGQIVVELRKSADYVHVIVQDDGDGGGPLTATGRGSGLVASLAEAVDAVTLIERADGRRCSLIIPQKGT